MSPSSAYGLRRELLRQLAHGALVGVHLALPAGGQRQVEPGLGLVRALGGQRAQPIDATAVLPQVDVAASGAHHRRGSRIAIREVLDPAVGRARQAPAPGGEQRVGTGALAGQPSFEIGIEGAEPFERVARGLGVGRQREVEVDAPVRRDRPGDIAGALERNGQLVREAIGIRRLAGERTRVGRRRGVVAALPFVGLRQPQQRLAGDGTGRAAGDRGEGGFGRGEVVLRQRGETAVVAHVAGEHRAVERGRLQKRRGRSRIAAAVDDGDGAGEVAQFGCDGGAGCRRQPVAGELRGNRIVGRRAQAGDAFELLALGPRLARAEHDRNRHRCGQAHGSGPAARGGRRGRGDHAGVLTLDAEVRACTARCTVSASRQRPACRTAVSMTACEAVASDAAPSRSA